MKKKYFVYIVLCSDGTLYTGLTNNIQKRITQHNRGISFDSFTYSRRPVRCLYAEEFKDVFRAIARETQIKNWSYKKKIALIQGIEEDLFDLSSCKNPSHFKIFQSVRCHAERSRSMIKVIFFQAHSSATLGMTQY